MVTLKTGRIVWSGEYTEHRHMAELHCAMRKEENPTPTITVPREEVVRMLERAAGEVGLGLREFYELGKSDRLDDPGLRDMWLIWGDALTEDDLPA